MLAHSLLSRNKSDCQTDYKLRNFGNRNYLHAITKIQLNSVGVKISKMNNLDSKLFAKFEGKELDNDYSVKGGKPPWWKFWASREQGATHECCDGGTDCGGGDYTADVDYDGEYADVLHTDCP